MADEPWPTCDNEIVVGLVDHKLRCVLPRYHERDGHPNHENVEGVQWVWAVMVDD